MSVWQEILFLLISLVLLALFCSWMVSQLATYLAARSLVDRPNERSLHQGAVPRGGGLVIVGVLLVSLIVSAYFSDQPQTFSALGVILVAFAVLGWLDDTRDLSPLARLIAHLILVVVTVFLFGYVSEVHLSQSLIVNLSMVAATCTVLAVIWFLNLFNFMDGMDGLAGSQTIVGALTLAFWSLHLGEIWLAACLFVLAAASYGFLLHNWHPAKIFMGDVGSVSLGWFFAAVILLLHVRHGVFIMALALVFAVFAFDATVTLLRRLLKREKVWLAHRSHIYQRLAALQIPHSKIVLVYLCFMILSSALASIAAASHDKILPVLISILVLFCGGALFVARLEAKHNSPS